MILREQRLGLRVKYLEVWGRNLKIAKCGVQEGFKRSAAAATGIRG